jgi:lipoprotein-releasing system permease protein
MKTAPLSLGYELFIGLRYLRARRRETFISLITVISILGVMIGVMTLNVVMAVMTGFEETLRDRLLGINAHVSLVKSGDQIRDYERLLAAVDGVSGVVAASPSIYGQVMLTAGPRVAGVVVRGVDPDRVNRVVDIEKYIKEGSLSSLKQPQSLRVEDRTVLLPGLILGTRLANQLGVFPGTPVQVVSPLGSPTAIGVIPKVRRFMVAGIFNSGMSEIDTTLVYMNLADAQRFFELEGAVTNIEIRVRDVYRASAVADELQRKLGFPYFAEDWSRLWPNLFSALKLEKTVYFLVLLLMVLIGAFNIISTLIMVVMEKRKDIAILRSMGATRRSIRKIFLIKGFVIGFVGTVLGVLLGLAICVLIQKYQFIELPKDVFLISTVPVRIYLSNFLLVGFASLMVCVLASLYPARQAAQLDPVEIIRYE